VLRAELGELDIKILWQQYVPWSERGLV